MTDKFYADSPDKDAEFAEYTICTEHGCVCYEKGQYFNPFLKIRYTPRPWWKFWTPKYTVIFEGQNNDQ